MATNNDETGSPTGNQPDSIEATAETIVKQMSSGDFASATDPFAGQLKEQITPDRLAEMWSQFVALGGSFQGVAGVRRSKALQYDVALVTGTFERGNITFQFVFDGQGHVVGLQAHPDPGMLPEQPYEPPGYVKPGAFQEQEIQVGTGMSAAGGVLPGTLTVPVGIGPFPAVVLVHGSGPHDRDETIGLVKPFRDLAWGLASRGIAVVRYEKRTKAHPKEWATLNNFTVQDEVINDALAAVALLCVTPGVGSDRIFVLGHSLGATMAPRIGAADPKIAGLIIMAGLTRRLEDTILDQFTYIFSLHGSISPEERAQLDALKEQIAHIKDPALSPDAPREQILNVPASYWLDLRDYYPPEVASKLRMPILVLQAEKDYQVTMGDFEAWKSALSGRQDVTFKSYPGLVHAFFPGKGTPEEYNAPEHVVAEVIGDIADWINQEAPRGDESYEL